MQVIYKLVILLFFPYNFIMIILGVESTCDETGVALVENGTKVLFNKIASSSDILQKYGGIVPEVVAREQVKVIIPLIRDALDSFSLETVDAFAVSYGPGLVGSLLIGVETMKTIALVFKKPLIAVNHLEAHFYSNFLNAASLPKLPAIGLIVSGGHTDLVLVKSHGNFIQLGGTLDDAAGEAFDKVARYIKLNYPGGPEIEKHALLFSDTKSPNPFPLPLLNSGDFNFSFSGLKTSIVNYIVNNNLALNQLNVQMISYYFQKSCVEVLVKKTFKAAQKFTTKSIVVGGGVSANNALKKLMFQEAGKQFEIFFPEKGFAVDNGAMIAAAAFYNQTFLDPIKLSANPNLHF